MKIVLMGSIYWTGCTVGVVISFAVDTLGLGLTGIRCMRAYPLTTLNAGLVVIAPCGPVPVFPTLSTLERFDHPSVDILTYTEVPCVYV